MPSQLEDSISHTVSPTSLAKSFERKNEDSMVLKLQQTKKP